MFATCTHIHPEVELIKTKIAARCTNNSPEIYHSIADFQFALK
ncbi:hypothetical protein HDC90_000120 [Pedobacter sp. AK013]|nr:hypothetical protein [Pedobacter sp. AK013]